MKYSKIKTEIKGLSDEQTLLKPQRKTVNLQGERWMDSNTATQKALINKEKLRHLFVAYDVLKGRGIKPFKKSQFNQLLVDKYVDKFKEEAPVAGE